MTIVTNEVKLVSHKFPFRVFVYSVLRVPHDLFEFQKGQSCTPELVMIIILCI